MKPISKTAFYCCGVRMQDAECATPVCNDVYAKTFMSDEGLMILEAFKDETRPNASNVARHRIIDDLLRQELIDHPDLCVVIIGAGFDSRAFRLQGGNWVELDEPQVINYKNERLPAADSANKLHRIPIDFSNESLGEKLAPFSNRAAVVVVIEGVLMYLEQETISRLLKTLHELFPEHKLICDVMTYAFFENYGKTVHEKITGLGATFKFTVEDPEHVFLQEGYELNDKISIVEKSVVFETPGIPANVLEAIRPTLPSGYSICVFKTK